MASAPAQRLRRNKLYWTKDIDDKSMLSIQKQYQHVSTIFKKSNVLLSSFPYASKYFKDKESNDKNALSWRWDGYARSAMRKHET